MQKMKKGYAQLFDVIKDWDTQIILQSQYLIKTLDELKRYVDNYDLSVEAKVFQHIKNYKPFASEFFKRENDSVNKKI